MSSQSDSASAQALSSLVEAYAASSPQSLLEQLRKQLIGYSADSNYRVRLCALRWLCKLYPFSDPSVRFACIQMASDPRQEIRRFAVQGLTLPKVVMADFLISRSHCGSNPLLVEVTPAVNLISGDRHDRFPCVPYVIHNFSDPARVFSSIPCSHLGCCVLKAIKLTLGLIELEYARAEKVKDLVLLALLYCPPVKRL